MGCRMDLEGNLFYGHDSIIKKLRVSVAFWGLGMAPKRHAEALRKFFGRAT